ncbi:MAG: DUF6065 family protein [Phycisphaerae bacterium]
MSPSPEESLPVRFDAHPDFAGEAFPRPVPARQQVPDWLKQMVAWSDTAGTSNAPKLGTLKRCPPFADAMTAGYFIPMAADATVALRADGRGMDVTCKYRLVSQHPAEQVAGTPFSARPVIKLLCPWIVVTPPGWSTLFVKPINRFEMPLAILGGLVETDTYYGAVHFPAVWTLPPGRPLTIAAGEPIIQAIPVKRASFEMSVGARDEAAAAEEAAQLAKDMSHYRRAHRVPKKYG